MQALGCTCSPPGNVIPQGWGAVLFGKEKVKQEEMRLGSPCSPWGNHQQWQSSELGNLCPVGAKMLHWAHGFPPAWEIFLGSNTGQEWQNRKTKGSLPCCCVWLPKVLIAKGCTGSQLAAKGCRSPVREAKGCRFQARKERLFFVVGFFESFVREANNCYIFLQEIQSCVHFPSKK